MYLRQLVFKVIVISILIIAKSFCCLGQNKLYNYIYENNKLIADTNLLMDVKLEGLNSNTRYLSNSVVLLNLINPTTEDIEMGMAPKIIIKLYLKKQSISIFRIDSLSLININKSPVEEIDLFNSIKKDLINQSLYSVVENETYYLHLPVKIILSSVTELKDTGISKVIKDGWFTIYVKVTPVIDY